MAEISCYSEAVRESKGRESAGWPTLTSSGDKVSALALARAPRLRGSEALKAARVSFAKLCSKADRLVQFLSGLRAVLPADDLAPASEERRGLFQKAHLSDSYRVMGPGG